jgi:ribosomal-protein-alanine N-acetyltransferase
MSDQGLRVVAVERPAYATISVLYAECFDDQWSDVAIERVLEPARSFALLARLGSRPVGFLLCRRVLDEAEILSLGAHPELRRRGVGRGLLGAAFTRAATEGAGLMFLEVAQDNLAARALYDAMGFDQTGWRPGYYPRGVGQSVSAVLMSCKIGG